MMARSRILGVPMMVAALAAAGCSDSTAPLADFDPARAQADVAAMTTLMQGDQLAAFTAMSGYFDLSGAPLAAVSSARQLLSSSSPASPETSRRVAVAAVEGFSLRTAAGSTPSLATLPPEVFGTTFTFDPGSNTYVPSDRTGAPANGVRFIIYAVDPITNVPIVGTEVGHADLIDTSAGSELGAGLRLIVVGGSTTYLDYAFLASGTTNSTILQVDGFVSDGSTMLNFGIDATVAIVEEELSVDLDFSFAIPSRQFSVTASLDGLVGSSASLGEITLTIVSAGAHVRFEIAEDESTLNATVYVNNRIFATVTGDPADPTVLGAGGNELTAEEIAALSNLLRVAEASFEFFSFLMAPVYSATGGINVP
ncbi:MAG TPA: hypothetical protein VMM77_10390 [Gemmatimonadaceae bacterium]|nr:hypothetical protein [Gemmatimonadaceae bacterium]